MGLVTRPDSERLLLAAKQSQQVRSASRELRVQAQTARATTQSSFTSARQNHLRAIETRYAAGRTLRSLHGPIYAMSGALSLPFTDPFAAVVDAITDHAVFVLDAAGCVATWNTGAQRIKGYDETEVIGKHFSIFFLPDEVAASKPERLLAEALQKGRATDEGWRLRKDGTRFWANVVIHPLVDTEGEPAGFVKITRDETQRRALETARWASEQRFRGLIETSVEAFIAADRHGVVTEWNRRAEETFGWKRDEILGRSLSDTVVAPRHRPAHRQGLARYLATGQSHVLRQRLELEGRHRDGREFPVEVTIWALDAGGDVQFNALVRDISRRKQMEAAKTELDELKDAFVRTVSHDLRGPLAVIGGLAQLLQETDPPLDADTQRTTAGRIEANAARLERLASNLLDFDRVSHGRFTLNREPTDVSVLVAGVAANVEVGDHPLHVESKPATADVDRTEVERIVENLVANAVRHTPAGTSIWVRVGAGPDGVVITVDDSGPGVPDGLKRTIFEPYRRDKGTGGAGIGLSLVARFAELHGGRAWVEDRPGGGASFRVLIAQHSAGEPGDTV